MPSSSKNRPNSRRERGSREGVASVKRESPQMSKTQLYAAGAHATQGATPSPAATGESRNSTGERVIILHTCAPPLTQACVFRGELTSTQMRLRRDD